MRIIFSILFFAFLGFSEINSATEPTEERVVHLIESMSVEEKVAQMFMVEIGSITPEEVEKFKIGAILNGGGSFPYKKKDHIVEDWVKLADEYFLASIKNRDKARIPIIWGTDAVHGHNNLKGATLFPHNIGLGATRNPELIKEIGKITAKQVLLTGLDLTFAPALSVPRDDRWGRTYEGFSEDPEWVSIMGNAMMEGIQGEDQNLLGEDHILATVKHFIGDGGTSRGVDKGNAIMDEETLLRIHGSAYIEAIKNDAQVVMASFNSWNGVKLHGQKYLLTDVLKEDMGFDGFVVGDYNGHMEVQGCSVSSCPQSINAGVDMFMVTEAWQDLYFNTISQVQTGEISMDRIDDAVRRILRVKARAGILDAEKPSKRKHALQSDILGADEHRSISRQAVRESLVLLKNNQSVLPIDRSSNVLVLGQAAKEIKYQTGGWSMTWQGNENENSDFPGSTTILAAIENEFEDSQGSVTFSENLEYGDLKPDVAILVIAEDPYAEYQGTLQDLVYNSSENHLDWLVALKEDEIPVVTIFLSGRPLWMNREINLSDAFVAAWLPGTEGGGVSDMIIENEYDFVGSLTFSWPKRSDQATLNYDDEIYDPLFPVGYGLTYKDDITIDQLEESINLAEESDFNAPILNGWPRNAFQVILGNTDETLEMKSKFVATTDESVSAEMINRFVQEDAYRIMFSGNDDSFWKVSSTKPMNWSEEASQSGVLTMNIRILQADMIDPLIVSTLCGEGCGSSFEIEGSMNKNQWMNIGVDITCMGQNGLQLNNINEPVQIKSNGKWEFEVGEIKLIGGTGGTSIMICPNNKN
tara:strand:- start:115 stop:2550 length:2436 start_codon:yes stop_codon:yes gene_type:complete